VLPESDSYSRFGVIAGNKEKFETSSGTILAESQTASIYSVNWWRDTYSYIRVLPDGFLFKLVVFKLFRIIYNSGRENTNRYTDS
jgi:hypothetical protein